MSNRVLSVLCLVISGLLIFSYVHFVSAETDNNLLNIRGYIYLDENDNGVFDQNDKPYKDIAISLNELLNEKEYDINTSVKEYVSIENVISDKDGYFFFKTSNISDFVVNIENSDLKEKFDYKVLYDQETTIINIIVKDKKERKIPESTQAETSIDKINKSFYNGEIKYDEKMLLYANYLFGEELDEKYKSNKKIECGTPILKELVKYRKEHMDDERFDIYFTQGYTPGIADDLDDLDSSKEYEDYYSGTSGHFTLHYTTDDASANYLGSNYASIVQDLVEAMEPIYTTMISSGGYDYNSPLLHPLNNKINVYIGAINAAGYTSVIATTPGTPETAAVDITIDVGVASDSYNNYSYYKCIFAHELFHAITARYNDSSFDWFYEASAEFFSDVICDSEDHYAHFVDYYLDRPFDSLDSFDQSMYWNQYGACLFAFHLYEDNNDIDIIKSIYEDLASTSVSGYTSLEAIDSVLTSSYSTDLMESFNTFVSKNYDCSINSHYNDYSVNWDESKALRYTVTNYPYSNSTNGVAFLSSNYLEFEPSSTSDCSITVTIDAPDSYDYGFFSYDENSDSTVTINELFVEDSTNVIVVTKNNINTSIDKFTISIASLEWPSAASPFIYTYSASECIHSYDNACDSTCNNSGCSFVRTPSEHVYSGVCDSECNICNDTRTGISEHTYTDCEDNECDVCHVLRTAPGHSWTDCEDTTCDNDCGATRSAGSHIWSGCEDTTCDNNGCEATRTAPGHSWTDCEDTDCNVCAYTRTPTPGHTWSGCEDTTCNNNCGATRTALAHIYSDCVDNTCDRPDCSYVRSSVPGHSYLFDHTNYIGSSSLCYEDIYVCSSCFDEQVIEETDHTWSHACDTGCNMCSYIRTISHTYTGAWVDVSTPSVCQEYVKTCTNPSCGYSYVYSTDTSHSWTNSCDSSCNDCDYNRTISHSYTSAWVNVSTSSTCRRLVYTCSVCGYWYTASYDYTHSYTNSCDTSCNDCGYTRSISHSYTGSWENVSTASVCKEYIKTCTVCGYWYVYSQDTSHLWSNSCDTSCNDCNYYRSITHTYTNACDTTCNVCGATRSITHSWNSGTWVEVSTQYTCRKWVKTCTVCGATTTTSYDYTHNYYYGDPMYGCMDCGYTEY